MLYLRSFNRFILISLALLGLSVSSAGASIMEIAATGRTTTSWTSSDFTILYDDQSGDGLLQIGELLSFSGATLTRLPSNDPWFNLTQVLGTPNLAGVSTASGVLIGTPGSNWSFFDSLSGLNTQCCSPGFWTYANTIVPSAVPVPAAVWLFGTALIGFVGMSRRRKVA
jgi:hypothetical protein